MSAWLLGRRVTLCSCVSIKSSNLFLFLRILNFDARHYCTRESRRELSKRPQKTDRSTHNVYNSDNTCSNPLKNIDGFMRSSEDNFGQGNKPAHAQKRQRLLQQSPAVKAMESYKQQATFKGCRGLFVFEHALNIRLGCQAPLAAVTDLLGSLLLT